MIKKTKTDICNSSDTPVTVAFILPFLQLKKQKQLLKTGLTHLQLLSLHYDFPNKKAKTGIRNRPITSAATVLALRFLQPNKPKQVLATGLTYLLLAHLSLLPTQYKFYMQKDKNWYTCFFLLWYICL